MKLSKLLLNTMMMSGFFLLCLTARAQSIPKDTVYIGDYLKIHQLTPHLYLYVCSNSQVPSNGLVYFNDRKALLVDAPEGDGITDSLINWIQQVKGATLEAAIITHWHMQDRMGGVDALQKHRIKVYGTALTASIAKTKNLPAPDHLFNSKMRLNIGEGTVICEFLGAGHTKDNAVVWFGDDKVLFGGCLIKDIDSSNLGYVKDSDLGAWPHTVQKVIDSFPDVNIVIPGHHKYGNKTLLRHTLAIAQKASR